MIRRLVRFYSIGETPHLLGVKSVNGGKQGPWPRQAPPQVMVDGEAIFDGPVKVALRPAALDVVELLPP